MTNFAEKNDRRRRARTKSAANYRRARAARRNFATNGAFGNLSHDSHEYQLCESGRLSIAEEGAE